MPCAWGACPRSPHDHPVVPDPDFTAAAGRGHRRLRLGGAQGPVRRSGYAAAGHAARRRPADAAAAGRARLTPPMPIDLLTLTAALLTGLLGGVHCVAMCGGIAVGLSAQSGKPGLGHALALNGGRVLGYTFAGVIVGGLGGGLLAAARIDGLATTLRVALGALLVLVALRLLWPEKLGFLARGSAMAWRWIRPLQQTLVPATGPLRPWLQGL